MRIASSNSVMIFATPMPLAKSTTGESSGPVCEASITTDWPRAKISRVSFTAPGSLIGFNTVPIDQLSGDQVIITGFTVSQGSVFGGAGYPQQQPPIGTQPAGSYWIGQAMNAGHQTYQIQIMVTVGTLRPVSYYVNWDPFITAK